MDPGRLSGLGSRPGRARDPAEPPIPWTRLARRVLHLPVPGLLLAACADPPDPLPPPAGPAPPGGPTPPHAQPPTPTPPGAPAEARTQAARGAPEAVAPWSGPWTVQVWAEDPAEPGAVALASGLRAPISAWTGGRPAAPAGTVAVLWLEPSPAMGATSDGATSWTGALAPPPGAAPAGAVVAVLAGGEAAWRTEAAIALPWAAVAVVDPMAEARLFGVEQALAPSVLGALSAWRIAAHYELPAAPPAGPLPPPLAAALGPVDPADLGAADPRVRAEAARRQADTAAAQALVDDPDPAVRLAVATSATQPQVLAALARDPEPLVRARALDRGAAGPARQGLRDPSSVVRVVAAHRLASLARTGQEEALQGLWEAADSGDAYVRWKAAWGLAGARGGPDGSRARDRLEALLGDRDSDVRRQAARALGELGDPAAMPALIAALRDPNSFVRRWAAQGLGALGDPAAAPALRQAAAEPTALVAAAAAEALTRLGQPTRPSPYRPPAPPLAADEVRRLSTAADATLRKDLCKHLAGQPEHHALLIGLTRDADGEVRKSAVEALGWDAAGRPALRAALSDDEPDVVITALDGLRRMGGDEDPALLALLDHPDAELRLRAAEALAAWAGPGEPARRALEALARDPDERVRAAAVRAAPGRVAPDEVALLVRHAAGRWPGAPAHAGWAEGLLAREDELVHQRFSWNDPADRPAAHQALRPPVIRPYGHPDRG